ncbi:hypothetical protein [Iodobacter fluviatilis]|uniref:Uncharacterized protein n=1 Tax=Iodobacter fluviatilis TaxID=537 RepID=A0A377Q8R1_9NEIS|nr:hypothetical protein [Iodobacter fluviatilis]TCU88808.1 hypothetical protein EV682_103392 [Iodobacter fluviatilis]STQ91120.1 Uncharacterised protein [Iodobacter fluviatilis]
MNQKVDNAQDANGVKLRLSAQRALCGNIPRTLRSVSVEYHDTVIACRYVFDDGATTSEMALLSCAGTEIIADYNEPYTITEEFMTIPFPIKPEYLRYLVYMRAEGVVAL